MNGYQQINRAYQSAINLRSLRERDAEVFEIFAARLRGAETEGTLALAKALADYRRLWQTVTTVTIDDNNPQPMPIRKTMLSLSNAVIKELGEARPNLQFLVEVNGNVAAGLRGVAPVGGPVGR
jgi:flagellar biosynthesis regulator FlaF